MSATPQLPRAPALARALAKDAYIYGFPLVDNYRILHSYFVNTAHPEYKGAWNTLHHETRLSTPQDRARQAPNSDTVYSRVAADLRAEPLVFTVPPARDGRYYSLQFMDLHTHNFAYVGSRSTGNDAGVFLLAGPNWRGRKPAGVKAIFRCETELGLVLFRAQPFDASDLKGLVKGQAEYHVQTLSNFLGESAPSAPAIEFPQPLTVDQQRQSPEFFRILNFVLRHCPTHPTEKELMTRFSRLGIGAGVHFDVGEFALDIRKALEDGMADAWRAHAEAKKSVNVGEIWSADCFGSREYLSNNYLYRMIGAVDGIYGNSKEEAVYPAYFIDSIGDRLDGANHRYSVRFAHGALPPAFAFWSLTIYELPSRALSENALNRYTINSSMLPRLARDADGGVTLHIQHDSPGRDRETNWLPAPLGPFFASLRLYWPKPAALDGSWQKPPMRRVS